MDLSRTDGRRSDRPDAPPSRRASALPALGERTAPWLAAAFVAAMVNLVLVLTGTPVTRSEQALLLLGLSAAVTAAGLVTARANREQAESDRDERARPALEELEHAPDDVASARYVDGMGRWVGAIVELLDHAVTEATPGSPAHGELVAATAEARELRDLLQVSASGTLTINEKATLHALCSLWEANQPRLERLAAQADPAWHRRWRARSVVEERLRHGTPDPRELVLPYRA